jgi:MFS family permease
MDNAGALVGPLVATALLALGISLRSVFLLAAIPGAMAMTALIGGVREPERAAKPATPQTTSPTKLSQTDRTLTKYLVAVSLFALGNSSDAFLLLRAQQCGVVLALIPMLWMVHNGTKAALSTWAGALSDRLGRRRVIIGGWAVYALVYLAFGHATHAWQIWSLFVLYGVYYALTEGTEKALIADLAPAGARGRAFGWYNGLTGLMALPASLGFGALADRYGAPLAFTVSAALALAASLWLALLVRVSPRPASAG